MKRLFGAVLVLLVALIVPTQAVFARDTNNFRISKYDIQYELSRDSEGRSVLKTTEVITAEFPNYAQNHGIERAIPTKYDGHPTSLEIIEAANIDGNNKHSTSNEGDVTLVRIGDPNKYAYGTQTYKLVYEQRDVTRYFEDTGRDEWYWDTNGTEWQVPIDALTVQVSIDDALTGAREGEPACYQGASGSTEKCTLTKSEDDTKYTLAPTKLAAGENISVAFGFKKDTFAAYVTSTKDALFAIWVAAQFFALPVAVIVVLIAAVAFGRRSNRHSETHTIVTEYIPPKDASVVVASKVMDIPFGSVMTAQLIDLAVRRFISIVETREKTFWRQAEYDIVIQRDLTPLLSEEKEIISDMFGHLPKVGERLALKKLRNNMRYSARTRDNDKKIKDLIEKDYGLRQKDPKKSKVFYVWAGIIGAIALLLLSIPLGIAAGLLLIFGYALKPLTDKGLALRRYVLGLNKYVRSSEKDRLAFLQGPDTAEKVGFAVDTNDPGQLVKLYERTLPYAILFGHEKQWSKRLGEFYEQTHESPQWFNGSSTFNAAYFVTAMNSFSHTSTYTGGSSTTTGGSSGGGGSGGGGGGGGGGGW